LKDKVLGGKRAVLVRHLDQSGPAQEIIGHIDVELAQKLSAILG
jgi:hypothetical protein